MNVKLLNKIYLQLPFFGPLEIIFSFDAYRLKLKNEENSNICKNCGTILEKSSKSNIKKFCSDSCRYKWWRKNLENNRSYLKIHICKNCNKKFKSFDNKDRKYCSHKCYINDRFKPKKGNFINGTRAI